MSAADDLEIAAGEYVLGTLDVDERAAFAGLLSRDEAARLAVSAWEHRFAPLLDAAAAVHPPAAVWTAVAGTIGTEATHARAPSFGKPASVTPFIVRSRNRWRAAALAASGIAAVLIAYVGLGSGVGLREQAAAPGETYVAAVNRDGDRPALIVTVDLKTRRVLVRPVAAKAPSGHSLQLWYIGDGRPPLSMGLVTDATRTTDIPNGASAGNGGVIAVSLEPPGGSKTGGPTGAVLYSGQLVKE